MGRAKKTQKFRRKLEGMKKMLKPTDSRIAEKDRVFRTKKEDPDEVKVKELTRTSAALFLEYNTQLGPPFHILLDTNFINFSIKHKIDINKGFMDALAAKAIPYVTECVVGELEKMGRRFRVALKMIADSRFKRLSCLHKGTYADDCLVQRVTQSKAFLVATCDKDLRRRIRKIPGVPIVFVRQRRYGIERMPDAYGAPKL